MGNNSLRHLLGSHMDYDGEASTVVPLSIPSLALLSSPAPAQPVLSEAAGPYSAEGFYAKYVRSNPAPVESEKEGSFSKPYLDPGLKSRRRCAELLPEWTCMPLPCSRALPAAETGSW